jgi:hypothetical protein
MSRTTTPPIILIPVHREQYLAKDEARIIAAATIAARTDATIKTHLQILNMSEDLQAIHESAATRYSTQPNTAHIVARHNTYAANARQIYLHHLDRLATLLA